MKKKKNAFTLIELLAIIVILAIIAVITVPIILNVIDNARKGAAINSAYGYRDAINKYYATELANNRQLQLEGEYTIANGVLKGDNIEDANIPVSGTIPSSGTLTYSNNSLTSGCLVIGEYAVTFASGTVSKTEKNGECKTIPTMAEMCPGCVFGTTSAMINSPLADDNDYSTSYTDLGNYFLGQIVENNIVKRSFACGIEDGTPFCLEGYAPSKYDYNVKVLTSIYPSEKYPSCSISASNSSSGCFGLVVIASAQDLGGVGVRDGSGCSCSVASNVGASGCWGCS